MYVQITTAHLLNPSRNGPLDFDLVIIWFFIGVYRLKFMLYRFHKDSYVQTKQSNMQQISAKILQKSLHEEKSRVTWA